MKTLVDILRHRAKVTPHQMVYTYLEHGEDPLASYDYRELDTRARMIAHALQQRCAVGDRALLLYPPGLDFIAAFFGCLYAGVLAVPAYPPDFSRQNKSLPRLQAILHDATPRVILTNTEVLNLSQGFMAMFKGIEHLPWLAVDALDLHHADHWQEVNLSRDHLAFLQYTSGSTSEPKGVMLSHGNIMYNEQMIQHAFGHDAESVFVSWLPQYHDMGLIGNLLQPLYAGGSCYFMSPQAFLRKPVRWLQAISRYRAHTTGAPNFAFDLCTKKVTAEEKAELDLSSWKLIYSGAEPVRHESLQGFSQAFAPCGLNAQAIFPVYGLAEATLFVSGGKKGKDYNMLSLSKASLEQNKVEVVSSFDLDSQLLVSCGSSWLAQQIVIANPESCTPCLENEVGEIWIQGQNVAQGYWNKPEATRAFFAAYLQPSQAGPFFRTGDLGFIKDGELFVTGRIKDLIKIRGRSLYPQDLEQTVESLQQQYPEIRLGCVAAFALTHQDQEHVGLVLEVDPDKNVAFDADLLSQKIFQTLLAEYGVSCQRLTLIAAGDLPKTSSGKIMRHACQKIVQSNTQDQAFKVIQKYQRSDDGFYLRKGE